MMNMKNGLVSAALLLLLAFTPDEASAQCGGVFAPGAICANPATVAGPPQPTTSLAIDVTNPTAVGCGIAFSNPGCSADFKNYNALAVTATVDASAPCGVPSCGSHTALFNGIVRSTYTSGSPTYVTLNAELFLDAGTTGNDFWANLGVVWINNATSAASAVAGIIRGNWVGTNISVGLLSVAENYTGRAAHGIRVSSSQTDGKSLPFNNAYSVGVFVHHSSDVGVQVGGRLGSLDGILPSIPFVIYKPDQSSALWKITNNGGTSVSEYIVGDVLVTNAVGGFPAIGLGNVSAGADAKYWQSIVDSSGTFLIRTVNDALNVATNAISISRSGLTAGVVNVAAQLTVNPGPVDANIRLINSGGHVPRLWVYDTTDGGWLAQTSAGTLSLSTLTGAGGFVDTKLSVSSGGVFTFTGSINVTAGISAGGSPGLTTTCTVTVGNTLVFKNGILVTKGANCT